MKELNNEIEINASAEKVWQLLTDFASFSEWNPFIQHVNGQPIAGSQLEVTTQHAQTERVVSRPTVVKATPNNELRWLKRSLIPGLFDAEHVFTIEELDANRVRFTQRAIFTGFFSSFLTSRHNTENRRGLREMNHALKQRAEQPLFTS